MTYACKQATNNNEPAPFHISPQFDLCSHLCLQILDIIHKGEHWCIINFYHDVQDKFSLQALLSLDIEATIPTLIMGDFNTHSPRWSPLNVLHSHWATNIKEWATSNLLTLANTPGTITCRGASHKRDSTIDLVWFNEAAVLAANFSNLEIDWEGSLGSDHALLKVKGQAHNNIADLLEESPCGFVIDPGKHEAWVALFCNLTKPPPLPPSPSAEEIEAAAGALVRLIDQTYEATFHKRQPLHPKAAPWWNMACATVVQNLRDAQDPDTRHTEHQCLKGMVKQAKQEWAEECIEKEQLWDIVNWIHGCHLTKVPLL